MGVGLGLGAASVLECHLAALLVRRACPGPLIFDEVSQLGRFALAAVPTTALLALALDLDVRVVFRTFYSPTRWAT